MFSKRVIAGLSMLTLAAVVIILGEKNCRAQAPNVPNFGGTWELVEHDGTTKRQIGSKFPRVTLVISQKAPEIKITQKTIRRGVEKVQEFIYYTDGRGETNTGQINLWPQDEYRTESVTEWHEGKLLTKYKRQLRVMPGYALKSISSDAQEEWRLTSDGKKLARTESATQMDSPSTASNGQSDLASKASFFRSKLVFRKVS